jgi:phosphopantothenoylcysteine decarboxylase
MKILLGVTGSVATILARKLAQSLKEIGDLKIVKTEKSCEINSTLWAHETIGADSVYEDSNEWKWRALGDPVLHIDLRDWYDVFVIAPLTANTLGKMANGICDNLLTTIWMASLGKKVIVAPAMNTQMWNHPIVQKNLQTLKDLGVIIINPINKKLACGETGIGAMADICDIVAAVKSHQ